MSSWLAPSRHVVYLVLGTVGLALVLGLAALVVGRAFEALRSFRRGRIVARYRPLVDAILAPKPPADTARRLAATPKRHRVLVGMLILSALRLTNGAVVVRLRDAATSLGLVERWTAAMDDRRWWVRADSARALGLVRESSSRERLIESLDDPHPEVRAAVVDALGRLGNPRSGPELLLRLRNESRHQRVRLVEAIRALGPPAVPMLVAHARRHSADMAVAADIIGTVGGTAAVDSLLEWTGALDPAVRAASLRALGSIGLDERSLFYALRGLDDGVPDVRGMAARALGRSGAASAVPYLAAHLGDEWIVAAQCAAGLRRLGGPGALALEAEAGLTGRGADLARHMLWGLAAPKAGA